MADETLIPRLAPGVKFRFDAVRAAWVLLAPEKLYMPDEHAVEVLKLVDGQCSLAGIINSLTVRFNAPRDEIAEDVAVMVRDLADKGALLL